MATVKYHASGHFDIDTELTVDDNCTDDLEIWLSIIDDLVNRYNLDIQYTKEQKND